MSKVFSLVLVLSIVGITSAELIVNGDFEAGAWDGGGSGSGAAFGWTSMPPSHITSGGSDGGAYMKLDSSAIVVGAWQWGWSAIWTNFEIVASTGQSFTLEGMAKNISHGDNLRVFWEWKDASGSKVDLSGNGTIGNEDRVMVLINTGAEWELFTDSQIAPSLDDLGNPFASPITNLGITFGAEVEANVIGLDQVSLVPEPITIGLLGLGGLFIRRRK